MRVALVSYYYPEYVIALANALSELAVTVRLLMPQSSLKPFTKIIASQVDVCPFRSYRLRDPRSVVEAWRIVWAIRSWRADVIHLQQGYLWFNLFALPFIERDQLVTSVHDVLNHKGDRYSTRTPQWVWDIAAHRAAHVIVHGQALKVQYLQRHALSPERVHVIPLGEVSSYGRSAAADDGDSHTVLFFGRIWPYKGLQYLIEAEPLISRQVPDSRIVIAGEGEDLTEYKRLMSHPDRFSIFNRFIPAEEIAGLFQQAAVVVLPYVEASQSGVIPLAYAFGKPVVATRVGSLPEVVEDGITGYLVPPRDVPQLAEAVIHLLKDQSLRHQMGRQAYQKAMTDLAWSRIAEETLKVYEVARSPDRGDL
jgi:glycosyltransferase involved in cell wall biosynthesis